jgi:hypothetical protein
MVFFLFFCFFLLSKSQVKHYYIITRLASTNWLQTKLTKSDPPPRLKTESKARKNSSLTFVFPPFLINYTSFWYTYFSESVIFCYLSSERKVGSESMQGPVRSSLFVRLVAGGRCWFVLREKYNWLVASGWFVQREKYRSLVADKPDEPGAGLRK